MSPSTKSGSLAPGNRGDLGTFKGNGVPGDPIGLLIEHAWNCVVEDISAPNLGSNDVLANSVAVITKDNNSKWRNVHSQSGWQPMAFDQDTAARASFTSGTTTVTSDIAVFTAAMVGEPLYLSDGSDTGSHSIWVPTIVSVDSSTQVTIDTTAPSTQADVKFRVGHFTGSVSNGSDQLTINNIHGLSSDYVGMQIHIMGAAVKSRASGNAGLLSTRIASVSGNTITLEAAATASVTDAVVLFAPPLFVGDFEEDASSLRTNHSWWSDVQLEGYPAAGLISNGSVYVVFDRLKLHGAGFFSATDWAECYYGAVICDVESLTIRDVQANYGILGPKFHISASYGAMVLDNLEVAHLRPDAPAIEVVNPDSSFRLQLGKVHAADLVGFPSDYQLFTGPSDNFRIESTGTVHYRSAFQNYTKASSAPVHAGATAQNWKISVSSDDVFSWKPPGRWGTLHVVSETTDVVAIVHYRISASGQGGYADALVAGSIVDVLAAETTLTGTTGADNRVTIAADSNGKLQIENRRSFGTAFALYHTPFGF